MSALKMFDAEQEREKARQALKKLVVDRVELAPIDVGNGKRTRRFTGELSYGVVLLDVVCLYVITPGFLPALVFPLGSERPGQARM